MKPFKELTETENKELLKFPALISLLAANNNKLVAVEKQSSVKFSHIKTYTCYPLLIEFYKEADKVFENNIKQLDIVASTKCYGGRSPSKFERCYYYN